MTNKLGMSESNAIIPYSPGSVMPAGTIIAYTGAITGFTSTSAADSTTLVHKGGWAVCNGASIARATYADLYARIGATWNTATNPLTGSAQAAPADTATNFRIPNLQGTFLRGVGDFTDNTKDTVLAGFQSDQFQSHIHGTARYLTTFSGSSNWASSGASGEDGVTSGPMTDGSYGTPRAGTETRPQNVGVYYLVKLYDNLAAADVYIPPASATTPGLLKSYDEGTFTITVTGPFSAPQTATIKYARAGNLVNIFVNQLTAACNSAAVIVSAAGQWPASLRPTSDDVIWMFPVYDNSGYPTNVIGRWMLKKDGSVDVSKDIAGNNYTGSGNGGWIRHTASYVI